MVHIMLRLPTHTKKIYHAKKSNVFHFIKKKKEFFNYQTSGGAVTR